MCCGKSLQSPANTKGARDLCACGAYALNFAVMEMLDGSCATRDEIIDDIYQDIKFDSGHPFARSGEEYSDPRKMCEWVNTNMKTITAKLYVNRMATVETHAVLAFFWSSAGLGAGDYATSEGVTFLGKQDATPIVTAVCAFAQVGTTIANSGMHFVAIRDKGGHSLACDPYYGKWYKTTKPTYKTLMKTYPSGPQLMYIGIAVVLTRTQ